MIKSLIVSMTFVVALHAAAQEPGGAKLNFNNSFSGAQGFDTSSTNAVHALNKAQEKADEHYKAERYERAYTIYRKLAEYGDQFSQYRVAYMHQFGKGVDKDLMQSFAWSYLAAETGEGPFVKYHRQIREKFEDDELEQAKQLAGEYLKDYGMYAQASRARGLISKEMRKCSGSRTGSTCSKVSASGWDCGINSTNDLPAADCLTLGMVGLPSIAGMQPADLRETQKNLATLQERYNPGRVELGELEFVDDEGDEADDQN